MRYLKPGPVGGRLIREAVALSKLSCLLRDARGPVYLACSSGPDSMAMAHLISTYGRRIVAPERLSLLHFEHGWRPDAAAGERRKVARLAGKLRLPLEVVSLDGPPREERGRSWEEHARSQRQEKYRELSQGRGAVVFTAHHMDDLVETYLWRWFTGSVESHGGGVLLETEREFRPLLTGRKTDLIAYCREEKLPYSVDPSNRDPRFLRSRIRARILPEIEAVFPRAVEHLARAALKRQGIDWKKGKLPRKERARRTDPKKSVFEQTQWRELFRALQLRARASHYQALEEQGRIDLPEGWVLTKKAQKQLV